MGSKLEGRKKYTMKQRRPAQSYLAHTFGTPMSLSLLLQLLGIDVLCTKQYEVRTFFGIREDPRVTVQLSQQDSGTVGGFQG